MRQAGDNRPFYYAFLMFAGVLVLTFAAAFHMDVLLRGRLNTQLKQAEKDVLSILETRFNFYKNTYYGLASIFKSVSEAQGEAVGQAMANADTRRAFEQVKFTAYVNEQTGEITGVRGEGYENLVGEIKKSGHFGLAYSIAFNEDRPIFFDANIEKDDKFYITGLIPVDDEAKSYVLTAIDMDSLMTGILKTSLLKEPNNIVMDVYHREGNERTLIYSYGEAEEKPVYKKTPRQETDSHELYFDLSRLEVVFRKPNNSESMLFIQQVTFTILALGTFCAIAVFGTLFFGLVNLLKKEKISG